jgi:hypothetical protein
MLAGEAISGSVTIFNILGGSGVLYGNRTEVDTVTVLNGGEADITHETEQGLGSLIADAHAELVNLQENILTLPATTTLNSSYNGTPLTLTPGVHKVGSGLTFNGTPITFDASDDINAKFYIVADGPINFTGILMTLLNGANSNNIYWVTSTGGITVDDTTIGALYGIFIGHTTVTMHNRPIYGFLYSITAGITFTATGTELRTQGITAPNGVPCFPGYTPINTDQGNVPIARLVPGTHTINGKKIVSIIKAPAKVDHLVCFEKHSLGLNVPSQRTLMTTLHRVVYNGRLINSGDLLRKKCGLLGSISMVPCNEDFVYNILMDEHNFISVNNLTCETLHPDNTAAIFELHKIHVSQHMAATACSA